MPGGIDSIPRTMMNYDPLRSPLKLLNEDSGPTLIPSLPGGGEEVSENPQPINPNSPDLLLRWLMVIPSFT